MLGEAPLAQQFSRTLFAHGLFAAPSAFPPWRVARRIRVMISASHSQADLVQALDIFGTVGKQLGVI
ncbi:hypothetical protein [Candidatus Amarolinea dominans]|uniref:hypothetical protein n=1 Tax=Candidatus Amarolinea dominans TaxID=3140696 RepID=UPI0031CC9E6A